VQARRSEQSEVVGDSWGREGVQSRTEEGKREEGTVGVIWGGNRGGRDD